MKGIQLFNIGLLIDGLILVLCVSSIGYMEIDGLSAAGKLMLWCIPVMLIGLISIAFWLKKADKLPIANILIWITAFPMLMMIILWGGTAVLFVLSSIGK
ncbi:MAG: hypothetical protein KDC34_19340 [Saprospiraceae bacterium]|nr:hypothetical protein [Saprospiraceae bacterium]